MTRDKPVKENKIADIICTICIVIITGITLCLAIYLFQPPKAYVQEWTSPAGITYYISNMHMQAVSGNECR